MTHNQEIRERVWKEFQKDTTEHIVKSLHVSGLMRCVTIGKPRACYGSFTLTTWPNHLAVSGDAGTWVFERSPDMFEFFRGPVGEIDPGYWSQKLVASCTRSNLRVYDADIVREYLREACEGDEDGARLERYLEAVDEYDEHETIRALEDAGVADVYEIPRSRLSEPFIWVCHAIVFGIAKCDEVVGK